MKVSRSALLPYSARNMYDVVADIRSYPGFLGWCDGTEIISESTSEVVAKLLISVSKVNFSFTTKNTNTAYESIELSLVDGPFSSLSGQWRFQQLGPEACKVSLDMDFQFDGAITHKLFARIFEKVIITQLDAFQKRAEIVYAGTKPFVDNNSASNSNTEH